ncbi:MAG: o-succinylbenzoate--CoA ligase [Candidatus Hydrogenedentes bacterium]|nr:o-succinylbenzoate--CoA ligase [Candidatus Hydrogenedentota bacterium]
MNEPAFVPCRVAYWASAAPDGIALRREAIEITWAEWHGRIGHLEKQLRAAGAARGTRVGLIMPAGEHLLSTLLALYRIGAVACPVNPQFPSDYREGLLADLDCALVIGEEQGDNWGLGASVTAATPPTPPQAGGNGLPGFAGSRETSNSRHELDVPLPPACGGAGGVYTSGAGDSLSQPPTPQTTASVWHIDPAATIIFTSGSTGTPKAAVLSLRNHLENARISNANIPLALGDTWLLSLPMHHVAGFGVLFRCLVAGATIALPEPGAPLALAVKASGATHISLVARQLAQVLGADAHLERLKSLLLGGSAIPAPLIDRALAAGLPIHTSYGMTETASQIAATPPGANRAQLASSGRPLVAGAVRINEDGCIQVAGPTRFLGYWRDGALQRPFDDAGWFTTSDQGYLDDEGFLHVTGRKDNVFIAGGENIQPEEIERALCALPGIIQAIVVPVAHPEFGTTPVAFVACSGPLDAAEISNALLRILPRFKVPRHYYPWPDEHAEVGLKVSRAALARRAASLQQD